MKEIIAMHGWAGDSSQWSNWKEIFQRHNWKWQTAERGYKEKSPHTPTWNNDNRNNDFKRVALCHSLGSHLIDNEVLYLAHYVILINSFSRFIPNGKKSRSISIALKKMMDSINTPDEYSMLRKFHLKAYKPNFINLESHQSKFLKISDSGRVKLKHDLKVLINTNSLPIGLNSYAKVLIINSQDDFILAQETKQQLYEDLINFLKSPPTVINLEKEGHSLSKLESIKKIKQWLEFDYAN